MSEQVEVAAVSGRTPVLSTLSDPWASVGLHNALQVITDGIRELAGFEVSAVAVRVGDTMEYVAVCGADPALRDLLGASNSLESIEQQLASGESWGSFTFVAHTVRAVDFEATWTPSIPISDHPGAWHPHDMLMAQLFDAAGEVQGLLIVDVPANGMQPDQAQRDVLNAYAGQASQILASGLARRELELRLRLSQTARQVVRNVNPREGVRYVLDATANTIKHGFSLAGLWTYLTALDEGTLIRNDAGNSPTLPGGARRWLTRAAEAAYAHNAPTILSRESGDLGWGPWANQMSLERTHMHLETLLLVPVVAGVDVLGCMLMGRWENGWEDSELETAMEIGRDLGQAIWGARFYERDLELVQRLERLDDHKRELIATMAHEFKNPLAAVAGHVELLEPLLEDGPGLRSLNAINRSTTKMLRLVEDLLQFSRVTEPGYPLTMDLIDLNPLIREVVEIAGVAATARQIQIKTDLGSSSHWVWGDAHQLNLLATNLVSNAVKYSNDGGLVEVSLTTTKEGLIELQVVDYGIGIAAEDQERIFEEFWRTNNPSAHRQPGTGLGLAIVAGIVSRHDAKVEVESVLEQGTTFMVRFPAPPRQPLAEVTELN